MLKRNSSNNLGGWIAAVACAVLLWTQGYVVAAEAPTAGNLEEKAEKAEKADESKVFATIGEDTIAARDFKGVYDAAVRRKYYHAVPPTGEAAKLQREIGDELITNVVLNQEAKRRGILPDEDGIKILLDRFDQQYAGRADWQKVRETALPKMKIPLEAQSRRDKLEKLVRAEVPQQPTEAELQAYYDAHKELFTEPEKVHLRMILLKVDPSSSSEVWDKAMEEGKDIVKRLQNGADFAELAKLHSGDVATAEDGGDLGYLHKGMLPSASQPEVDKLQPGQVGEPFRGLEGVYILRLENRNESNLRSLDEVKQRAVDLWRRDVSDQAWKSFVAGLRAKTQITIDESFYLPLVQQDAEPSGDKQAK